MLINHLDNSFFAVYRNHLVHAAGTVHFDHQREPCSSETCGSGRCYKLVTALQLSKTFLLMVGLLREGASEKYISASLVPAATVEEECVLIATGLLASCESENVANSCC